MHGFHTIMNFSDFTIPKIGDPSVGNIHGDVFRLHLGCDWLLGAQLFAVSNISLIPITL